MEYKTCGSREEALAAIAAPQEPPCLLALYPDEERIVALSPNRLVATKIPACCQGAIFSGETISAANGPVYIIHVARPLDVVQKKMTDMKQG